MMGFMFKRLLRLLCGQWSRANEGRGSNKGTFWRHDSLLYLTWGVGYISVYTFVKTVNFTLYIHNPIKKNICFHETRFIMFRKL